MYHLISSVVPEGLLYISQTELAKPHRDPEGQVQTFVIRAAEYVLKNLKEGRNIVPLPMKTLEDKVWDAAPRRKTRQTPTARVSRMTQLYMRIPKGMVPSYAAKAFVSMLEGYQ